MFTLLYFSKSQTYPTLIIYILATFEDLDSSKGKKKMDPTREQAKYIFGDSWGYSFRAEIKQAVLLIFPIHNLINCQLCIIYKFQEKT